MSEQRVMTEFGPGVIVASETVRGSTTYKIEGEGFSVWRTAQQIPEFGQLQWDETPSHKWDNSTTLPYNPRPQFYPHDGYSTIQPNQQVDPDRRLQPADSVSFEERPDANAPGPNPALFARTAAQSMDELSPELQQTVNFAHSHAYDWATDQGFDSDAAESYASWLARYVMRIEEMPEYGHDSMSRDWLQEEHGGEDPRYAARSIADIQARLGDKYAAVNPYVDHNSLQARLDDDPYRVLSDIRMSNLEKFREDPRIREALLLEQADTDIRTAAWADVRAKALRLRSSGNIQLEAANPTAIVATVTGDHGIYDVAVIKGNAINGSSAVTDWTCSCPWGDWAFERKHTFIGRLCSHAYAALLEHQSITQRADKPYGWRDKVGANWPPSTQNDDDEDDSPEFGDPTSVEEDEKPQTDAQGVPSAPAPAAPAQDPTQAPADPNADPNAAAAAGGALGDEQSVADEVTQTLQAGGYDPASYDVQSIAHDMYVWSDAAGGFIPRTDDENEFWSTADKHALGGGADVGGDAGGFGATAARYPRPDGRLQTEPGTLTPDLHPIPKVRRKWREDLHVAGLTDAEREVLVRAGLIEAEFPALQHHDEPFEGSGPVDDPSIGTSEQYVRQMDQDGSHWHEEVDELSDGDSDTGGVQGVVAAHEGSDGPDNDDVERVDVQDENDVVANFQREAGAYLIEGGGGGGDDKIADAAMAFLEKTAGRKFTLREQQELIEEAALDGPIDQSDLDLSGTHYLL